MDQACASDSDENCTHRSMPRCANVLCMTLAAILLIGGGGALLGNERSACAAERRGAELDRKVAQALQKLNDVKALRARQESLEQRGARAALFLQKINSSFVVARVANSLPGGISLLAFSLDAPAEAPGAATRITLRGIAASQASASQFVDILKGSPLFAQTRLIASDPCDRSGHGASQVQVEMVLNNAATNNERHGEASKAAVALR